MVHKTENGPICSRMLSFPCSVHIWFRL